MLPNFENPKIMFQVDQRSQNVSITIHFGYGSFEQGFRVKVGLLDKNGREIHRMDQTRLIPSAAAIPDYYQTWKTLYEQQAKTQSEVRSTRAIHVPPQEIQRSVVNECRQATDVLQDYLEDIWFKTPIFEVFEEWIKARIPVQEEQSIAVVFEFDTGDTEQDRLLRRLPWNCWRLFHRVSNLEPTLASSCTRITQPLSPGLNILAIYGSDGGGLNLKNDDTEIQEIEAAGAQVTRTFKPSREKLHKILTDDKTVWDILFFAGHSFSNDHLSTGSLQIEDGENGVYELKSLLFDLQNAAQKGLKIAIFNSCDGLGIADYLTKELQIPCVLVFKEAVPDKVAREFLKAFLKEFKRGTPLYCSVRTARRNIAWMESDNTDPYLCASWLPVVCQNPIHPEFVWPQKKTIASPSWIKYLLLGTSGLFIAVLLFFRYAWMPKPTALPTVETSTSGVSLFRAPSAEKKQSIAILSGTQPDYDVAISSLVKSLRQSPNDPEAWVLLNNAIAGKKAGFLNIVDIATALPLHLETEGASLEILRGIAQAQSKFNCVNIQLLTELVQQQRMPETQCQGTDGKMLRVTIAGSDERHVGDTNNALAVAQYLSGQRSIVAVIGHYSSSASLQAAPEYAAKSLVALSPTSTSVRLTEYDNFFRTPPSDAIAAKDLAEYVVNDLGIRQVAIAHIPEGDAFSASVAQEFRNNLPSQQFVYESDQCNLTTSIGFDATKCVERAKANGAQAILLVPSNEEHLVRSLEIATVDADIALLGADSMYLPSTLKTPGMFEKQLAIAVPWHRSNTTLNSAECDRLESVFEQESCEMYKSQVNWRSAMAYDAVTAVIGAIKQFNRVPSREDVLRVFNERRGRSFGDGVVGPIQFDLKGDRIVDDALTQGKLGVLVTVDAEKKFVHLETSSD